LASESSPEASSCIRKWFDMEFHSLRHLDHSTFCFLQKQVINFFEQVLEQKEPNDCVKRSLAAEELERNSSNVIEDVGNQDLRTYSMCPLGLEERFEWKLCKRRSCEEAEGNVYHDELVFIVRIPLTPFTTSITLREYVRTDARRPIFVVFFQKRQNGLETLEYPIEGKVFTLTFSSIEEIFDMKPEYEACFLYVVPGNATKMEIRSPEVGLVVLSEYGEIFGKWMDTFLARRIRCQSSDEWEDMLPSVVLHACASALLTGPNQDLCSALKETFFMKQLDTTPEGLACIVHVCKVLLEAGPYEWP